MFFKNNFKILDKKNEIKYKKIKNIKGYVKREVYSYSFAQIQENRQILLIVALITLIITVLVGSAVLLFVYQSNINLITQIADGQSKFNDQIREIHEQLSKQIQNNKILQNEIDSFKSIEHSANYLENSENTQKKQINIFNIIRVGSVVITALYAAANYGPAILANLTASYL